MGLSVRQITQVTSEIESDLIDGNIQGIDQVQACSILFEIIQNGVRRRLFFSADAARSRCHLSTLKYKKPKTPPRFCQLLRAHLRHKRLFSLQQIPEDRIVVLKAVWTSEGDSGERTFVAELCGPASNFFLLDAENRVIDSLFRSRGRKLTPGTIYSPPEHHHTSSFTETEIPSVDTDRYSLNASIEHYYGHLEVKEDEEARKKASLSRLDQEIKKSRKRLKHLNLALSEAEKSRDYLRQGEMLKSHLHEIIQGMTCFETLDPLNPQKQIVISLDKSLTPVQNMAQFFKRWKKGESAKMALRQVIEETLDRLEQLESEKNRFIETGEIPLDTTSLPKKKEEKARQKKQNGTTHNPAIYISSDQMRLMVGRNALENDNLSFRLARGNDLWFHARGVPGSHLIVRMERRKEIPYQTLLDAATLALHFSRYKKAGKGEVLYTYRKYIRKPKKGKPGAVICSQEKTLYIEMDATRLKRILENRLEVE